MRDYYLIHYVESGTGILRTGGVDHTVTAGRIFIIREGEDAMYFADEHDPWSYIYIGLAKEYAPMLFIVCTDKDLEARYEQTLLTVATMKHFGYDMSRIKTEYILGEHCAHDFAKDENGISVLGK